MQFGRPTPERLSSGAPSVTGRFPHTSALGTFTSPGRFIVPGGSLDRWFAYVNNPTGRRDLLAFGDSTTFGAEATSNNYSWLDRFRQKWAESGRPDGGKGAFGGNEGTKTGRDFPANEVNGLNSSATQTFGGGFPDAFDITGGQAFYDTGSPADHVLGLQFRGTAARLWLSARSNTGDIGVSVDGGAETILHGYNSDRADTVLLGGREPNASRYELLSGLSSNTVHTVTVRNRGGRDAAPPTLLGVGQNGSPGAGTYPAGTWFYKVSAVFAGGETLPSAAQSYTNATNTNVSVQTSDNSAASYRLYRSATLNGTYALATNISPAAGGGTQIWAINGSTTWDSAQNPPTAGTTNLNTAAKGAYIHLAPMFDTGLTIQNYATSGGLMATFINAQRASNAFGLVYNGPNALSNPAWADLINSANYQRWDTAIASPYAINPVLAVLNLGFNDLSSGASTAADTCTKGVQLFAALCAAAGCDGLVLSGQEPYNANWPTYGPGVYAAMRDTATSLGLAWLDMFYPIAGPALSYTGGTTNPHLYKSGYQTQADYLWDFARV